MKPTLDRIRVNDAILLHQIEPSASFFYFLLLFVEVAFLDGKERGVHSHNFRKQFSLCLIHNAIERVPVDKKVLKGSVTVKIEIEIYSLQNFLNVLFYCPNAWSK